MKNGEHDREARIISSPLFEEGETMRRFFILIFIVLSVLSFAVSISIPVGPTVVAFSGLLGKKISSDVEIKIDFWRTLDQVNAQIVTKNVDLIVLPVSIGASLYSRGLDLKLAAVIMWSGFYIVTKDLGKVDLKDLVGQEVYTPQGKGQTGDVLIRYLLERNGLKPDSDVKIRYATPPEIVSLMSAGKIKIAVLPEPYVTLAMRQAKASIAYDLQQLWSEHTGLPARVPITGVFIVRSLDKETLHKTLTAIEKSLKYAVENTREAAVLSSPHLGGIPVEVVEESLTRTLYEYRPASEIVSEVIHYLSITQQVDPSAMPSLPDEKFFAF